MTDGLVMVFSSRIHQFSVLILLILLLMSSCNLLEDLEYVTITMENRAGEPVRVTTGRLFMTVTIAEDDTMNVTVVKGALIKARGKDSGTLRAERRFYVDGITWIIP